MGDRVPQSVIPEQTETTNMSSLGRCASRSRGLVLVGLFAAAAGTALAARGESLTAFDGRCILAGCVAPPSNMLNILSRRALPARRLARLGATPDFHHGLLAKLRLKPPSVTP
jgi:hypothetical protein